MKIKDYTDYLAVVNDCCQCENPDCFPDVDMDVEWKELEGTSYGFKNPNEAIAVRYSHDYLIQRTTWSNDPLAVPPATGHITTLTYTNMYKRSITDANGITSNVGGPVVQTTTQGGGTSFKQPQTTEYINPVSYDTSHSNMETTLTNGFTWDDALSATGPFDQFDLVNGGPYKIHALEGVDANAFIFINKLRYRMRISDFANPYPKWLKINWQFYALTYAYQIYYADYLLYLNSVKNHNLWLNCTIDFPTEDCGPEPEVLTEPTLPAITPILIASEEWEFDGSNPLSPFYEYAPFDLTDYAEADSEGFDGGSVVRICNQLATCYRSEQFGSIPRDFSFFSFDPNTFIPTGLGI